MINPTAGFIVYGVHKDGIKDPTGVPYINDMIIKKSKIALQNRGVNLIEHNTVVASKAEAKAALKKMKNEDNVDCVIFFTGTWVWVAHLIGAIRDFAFTGKGILIWTNPGSQGWRTGSGILLHAALNEIGIIHKFVFGSAENPQELEQVVSFCKASNLKNALNMSTIGAFGGRGMGQTCGVADPSQWMRVFGVDIDTRDTEQLIKRSNNISLDKIKLFEPRLKELFGQVPEMSIANERSIRLYLALKEIIREEGFDFYTIQSFPGISEEYSAVCFAQSIMLEDGIGTSVFCDFNTAMTVFLLAKLSKERVYYGDIQDIDRTNNELKIVGDGNAPPSLGGKAGPASYASRGIKTEGKGAGLSVKLVCKPGEGVLARLGRINGEFEMIIVRCTVFEPPTDKIEVRKSECGIPFWPHAFVKVHCDINKFLKSSNNEFACLGYGKELYQNLIDFCDLMGIRSILP